MNETRKALQLAHDILDDLNADFTPRYPTNKGEYLCAFCASKTYSAQYGIDHAEDCVIQILRYALKENKNG